MRSAAEIAFRLRQELANLALWKFPPKLTRIPKPPKLPEPPAAALRRTPFAAEAIRLANEIVEHRIPIFGKVLDTGREIRWRRDYQHGVETGTPYFRRVPYLDFRRVGDHKYIWELNRHQHLVLLAQAFCFTQSAAYLDEIQRQVESWLEANPFLRGINWTSALEVAFRALSWIWVDHLTGSHLPPAFRTKFLNALYRHGCFLERNLSIYFSPNTHLLGEAVVLHALGVLYPEFPHAGRWRRRGAELVEEQMQKQVRSDGTHFEQSTYYHVYALDFFLWHSLLAETSAAYREKLGRAAEYLDGLLGPAGRIPLVGDEDGGRMFHPYGERAAFGRPTLATCGVLLEKPEWIGSSDDLAEQAAWWMGPGALGHAPGQRGAAPSRLFADGGIAVLRAGDAQIVIKAGGFGAGSAGHSHSDVLSVVCRRRVREILADCGTFTYLADPAERNRFRGSAAHNTIRINGADQAVPVAAFRWEGRPEVRIREWSSMPERDFLDAECRYGGFTHRRRFVFRKPDLLVVIDDVDGPAGEHLVEQFWHAGTAEAVESLAFSQPAEAVDSWRSHQFGEKHPAPGRCVRYRGALPVRMAAAVSFGEAPEGLNLHGETAIVRFRGGQETRVN